MTHDRLPRRERGAGRLAKQRQAALYSCTWPRALPVPEDRMRVIDDPWNDIPHARCHEPFRLEVVWIYVLFAEVLRKHIK